MMPGSVVLMVLMCACSEVLGSLQRSLRSPGSTEDELAIAPNEHPFLQFLPKSTYRVGVQLNVPLDDPVYNVYRGLLFRGDYKLPPLPPENGTGEGVKRRHAAGVPLEPAGSWSPLNRGMLRWSLYSLAEQALDSVGIPGHSCLLRSICESASWPLDHDGLHGEILHLLLTPSSSGEQPSEARHHEYCAAETWGAAERDCLSRYADCSVNLLQLFTTLVHV